MFYIPLVSATNIVAFLTILSKNLIIEDWRRGTHISPYPRPSTPTQVSKGDAVVSSAIQWYPVQLLNSLKLSLMQHTEARSSASCSSSAGLHFT